MEEGVLLQLLPLLPLPWGVHAVSQMGGGGGWYVPGATSFGGGLRVSVVACTTLCAPTLLSCSSLCSVRAVGGGGCLPGGTSTSLASRFGSSTSASPLFAFANPSIILIWCPCPLVGLVWDQFRLRVGYRMWCIHVWYCCVHNHLVCV